MNNIFTTNILNTVIQLFPEEFNNSIDDVLLAKLKTKVEGKCDKNGYIKHDSAEIVRRSMGTLLQGHFNGSCSYRISYKVDICNPVEGMMIKGIVKNMNKMGLFCELNDIEPSPLTIILAKQHHLKNDTFEKIRINDVINIEIIGIKFNYNDTQISCIGRLSEDGKTLEENIEYDEDEEDEEVMDLGDDSEDDGEDDGEDDDDNGEYDGEDDGEDNSLSGNQSAGGKNDIMSMVGGKINKDMNGEDMNGEDMNGEDMNGEDMNGEDMNEDVGIDENLELNLVDLNQCDNNNSELDLDDDLGIDFEGEMLDLDKVSRKDVEPIYLNENYERPRKISDDIFNTSIRENKSYKPFLKRPTNKINYHIYNMLSDLFINFYETYSIKPNKLSLSTRNKYFKSIKNYMKINAGSFEVEENDHRSFVC